MQAPRDHDPQERFGRIDALVNSAFFWGSPATAGAADLDGWTAVVDTNLLGTLRMTRAVVPILQAGGEGAGRAGTAGVRLDRCECPAVPARDRRRMRACGVVPGLRLRIGHHRRNAGREWRGLGTFTTDNNPEVEIFRRLGGQELRFLSRNLHGGGASGARRNGRSGAASEDLCRVPAGCRAAPWSWSMALVA